MKFPDFRNMTKQEAHTWILAQKSLKLAPLARWIADLIVLESAIDNIVVEIGDARREVDYNRRMKEEI